MYIVNIGNIQGSESENKKIFNLLLPALIASFGVGCLELGGGTMPGLGDFYALGVRLYMSVCVIVHICICVCVFFYVCTYM
jgi:hypothetical protein